MFPLPDPSRFITLEDTVLREAAVSAEPAAVVTRNAKDFRQSSVRLYAPAELAAILRTVQPRRQNSPANLPLSDPGRETRGALQNESEQRIILSG